MKLMQFTVEDLEQAAALARMELGPGEKEKFTAQLAAIMDFVQRMDRVDTAGVPPTTHFYPAHNVLREDVVQPSLTLEQVLGNAPETEEEYIRVPRIV